MFKWFRRNKDAATAPPPASVVPTTGAEPAMDAAAGLQQVSAEVLPAAVVEYIPDAATDSVAEPVAAESALVADAATAQPIASLPEPALAEALPEPVMDAHPEPVIVELQPEPATQQPAPGPEPAAEIVEPVGAILEPTPILAATVATTVLQTPAAEPAGEPARPRTLRERLAATARALTASVGNLFKRNPKLDEDLLEELETALIQADVGVAASTELVEQLRVRMRKREFADARALLNSLRGSLRQLLLPYAQPLQIPALPRPFVILTVGVNGAGKTTTIGKLAMRYRSQGHSVMLAAGDTFRAAAVEQLKTWGERNQVPVIAQGSGADSASVIFDAFQAAKSRGIDVLIADTAGRLHTQGHLMAELAKVKRVLGKIDPTAPHETLLVIDGGTGQNALNQAKQFHQAVGLTGIVVTKLDGTAKGGMLFALCRELALPVRFIGVGEKREDLREFVADDFVDALLPQDIGQN